MLAAICEDVDNVTMTTCTHSLLCCKAYYERDSNGFRCIVLQFDLQQTATCGGRMVKKKYQSTEGTINVGIGKHLCWPSACSKSKGTDQLLCWHDMLTLHLYVKSWHAHIAILMCFPNGCPVSWSNYGSSIGRETASGGPMVLWNEFAISRLLFLGCAFSISITRLLDATDLLHSALVC